MRRVANHFARWRFRPADRRGLTFLDVTVTVLIIGIMVAVAAPRFGDALRRHRADAAAKRIQADLRMARQDAIASSATRTVQFTPVSDSYAIPNVTNLDHSGQTYVVDLTAYPYQATLVSASLGGDSDIQFDRFGNPDSGGTISVQSGSSLQTVTVDAETGKATIP